MQSFTGVSRSAAAQVAATDTGVIPVVYRQDLQYRQIPANTGKYRSYTGKYPFISVYTNETSKRRVHSNRIALYARCWRAEDALIPAIPGLYRHFFRDIPANFKLYQLSPAYTGKVCVIPAFISAIPVNTPRYSPKPFNGLILLSTRLVIPSIASTIGLIAPTDLAEKHKSNTP